MEVQVEVSHAKSDRRAGIVATIVIHAVIVLLLIGAVLPASDVPMEELGGQGMEVGLGGVEGEGASGAPGGGEPQPSEAVPAESAPNDNTDPSDQEDMISNTAEDPIKVTPKTNPTKPKITTKKPTTTNPVKTTTPVDPNKKKLDDIWGSGGGDEGGGGTGTEGGGPGAGKTGLGAGKTGTGKDASNGRGTAKPQRILTQLRKEDHNCGGSSLQHVKIEIDKGGKIKKATGNAAGTVNPGDCFKRRAEQYVISNYVYAPCSDCNAVRYDEAVLKLESTDQ